MSTVRAASAAFIAMKPQCRPNSLFVFSLFVFSCFVLFVCVFYHAMYLYVFMCIVLFVDCCIHVYDYLFKRNKAR